MRKITRENQREKILRNLMSDYFRGELSNGGPGRGERNLDVMAELLQADRYSLLASKPFPEARFGDV